LQQQFLTDKAHHNPNATGQESFLHEDFFIPKKIENEAKDLQLQIKID